MKSRSFFSRLLAVVAVLLLAGAGGLVWIVSQSPLGGLANGKAVPPQAALFVSRQAPVMASLLVNPDRLESMGRLTVDPIRRQQVASEFAQLKASLLANTGLDYQQDIQPWLGSEITVAMTASDFDRDPGNGQQPGYLLAIATRDPEQARQFLQLFWQKRAVAGSDLVFEQYKGVRLIYGNNFLAAPKTTQKTSGRSSLSSNSGLIASPALASAVVGDRFVLFANHPKVLREALNNAQAADLSLSKSAIYAQATQRLQPSQVAFAVVNLPGITDWLSGSGTPTISPQAIAQETTKESAVTYQTLAFTLEPYAQGLIAETALLPTTGKGKTKPASLTQLPATLQYLPKGSSLAASGKDLNQFWHNLSVFLADYPTLAKLAQQPLSSLKAKWAIDLPTDVFSWVKEDYALGMVSVQPEESVAKRPGLLKPGSGSTTPEWFFIAQRTGENQPAIAQLDTLAQQQGLSVGPIQLKDQTVSAWTRLQPFSRGLQADVRGVHTTIGNYEIFTTSIAAMTQVLQMQDSFTTNPLFRQAISQLNTPNNGYFHLDWAQSRSLLEQQFPLLKVLEATAEPLFHHLQTITISDYGQEAGVDRSAIVFHLS
jgi:hypothetical protein